MPNTIVHCFLDTNVLMHFTAFDEVQWASVLGCEEVYLMFTPIVVREVDRFKDDSTNDRRRKRARMVLSKLRTYLPGNNQSRQTPTGAYVKYIPKDPVGIEWRQLGLDPQINDDRLLATMLEFRNEYQPERMILICDDLSLVLKAESHQVEVVEASAVSKRIEWTSSEEVRIKQLERENQELRQRLPRLEFAFWEDNTAVARVTRQRTATDHQAYDAELARLVAFQSQRRDQVIAMAPPIPRMVAGRQVNSEEVQLYQREFENYLIDLQAALGVKRSRLYGHRCELAFVLKNAGSEPADNVEITLTFPALSFINDVSRYDEFFSDVKIPDIPEAFWGNVRYMAPPQFPLTLNRQFLGGLERVYSVDSSNVQKFRYEKVRHTDEIYTLPIIAYISPEQRGGYEIHYRIYADNMPHPTTGSLTVTFTD